MVTIKDILDGVLDSKKADEVLKKINDKIATEKSLMDTETRRKVRKFWICVSILALIVGVLGGHYLWI